MSEQRHASPPMRIRLGTKLRSRPRLAREHVVLEKMKYTFFFLFQSTILPFLKHDLNPSATPARGGGT